MIPKTRLGAGTILIVLLLTTAAFAEHDSTWVSMSSMPEGSSPQVVVLESDANHTVIRLDVPGYYREEMDADGATYQIPRIPNAGIMTGVGNPELPVVTRWVAVPDHGSVEARIVAESSIQIPGDRVYPLQDVDEEYYPARSIYQDQNLYDVDDVYPSSPAQLSEPMIMRDYRVVAVSLTPIRTNPRSGGIVATSSIDIDIHTTGDPSTNEKLLHHSRLTPSFYKIYRGNIINFDELYDEGEPAPGSILIICPNNSQVTTRLQDLVDWKKRKGYSVTLATTAQTGATYSTIKSYIQTAYNTWDPPLEYVILAGDAEGTYAIPAYSSYYDHGYTQLDGNDIISDIAIGRLSFDNTTQLTNIVNKIVSYESNPYMTQTSWYNRGYFLAGTNHAYSPVIVKRYIRDLLYDTGITNVTIRDYPTSTIPASDMRSNINAGVLYFNYRGSWVSEMVCSHFQGQLSNGFMLPVAVTITCGTGTYNSTYEEAVSECWLREGSLTVPAGAIGCIGTATTGTHTRQNNIMDTGIFYGLFAKHLYNLGAALVEGKIQLVNAFPFDAASQNNFSYWNNLMGDPSLDCWTGVPQMFTVSYPSTLIIGQNYVMATVRDASANPVADALVCLWKGTETYLTAYTDQAGEVIFPITVATSGVMKLTVSKHDFKPFLQDINVVSGDVVTPIAWDIDDDNIGQSQGNNDSAANPGETIELSIQLKNWGSSEVQDITATLVDNDNYVTISQDSSTYGDIIAGGAVWSSDDYVISIAGNCPNRHLLNLYILVCDSSGSVDTSMVPIVVDAADLVYDHHVLTGVGGNGKFDPGESGNITVYLNNVGNFPASNVVGTLSSSHSLATVLDPNSSFGSIAGVSIGNNSTDPFSVYMNSIMIPGQPVTFTLALAGSGGFSDTVSFEEIVGTQIPGDPTGPDHYGYWAFENSDTMYLKHPTYHWNEIDPNYGGSGTLIPLSDYSENQDDSEVLNLPFIFSFYGEHFSQITVCSNGWLAFGAQGDIVNFRNYPIPGAQGPSSMVAAFWDDLVMGSGHVYWSFNVSERQYTVEWSNLRTRYNNYLETFQVVLTDPAFNPTPTGDAEILVQYQTVNNVSGDYDDIPYATVGIESPDQLDGIQYSYWNTYPTSASGLTAGLAILYTTDSGVQGVAPDTVGPEISLMPLGNTLDPIGPYHVNAEIWDRSMIADVELNYSDDGLTFVSDPMTSQGGGNWQGSIPGQAPGSNVHYFINALDDSGNSSQTDTFTFEVWDVISNYNFESGASGWTHYSGSGGFVDQWHLSMEDSYSPVTSWKCGGATGEEYANLMNACLVSPLLQIPTNAELHFHHRIKSEITVSYPDSAYDGGILEISCNGEPWEQLTAGANYNRYIRSISSLGNPYPGPFQPGTPCWAGTINWTEVTISLAGYQGNCQIRFRFGSDDGTASEGWFIDDVAIIGLPEGQLPPPQNLTISALGNHIYLIWDPVFGATHYTIYHATSPGAPTWETIDTVAEPAHSFQDQNALNGRNGFYRVVAGN
jgi:hypothetical protein